VVVVVEKVELALRHQAAAVVEQVVTELQLELLAVVELLKLLYQFCLMEQLTQ
jgi:hypothetical protein